MAKPYAPPAIKALYPLLLPEYPSLREGGVYANKAGYHNTRRQLQAAPDTRDDYSISRDIDLLGDPDAASAIDLSLNADDMVKMHGRLMAAKEDPRCVKVLRECFGSKDGKRSNAGYSWYRKREAISLDTSHAWHWHLSGWRKYNTDAQAWLGVAEVLLGLTSGALTEKSVLLPVYLVNPDKVKTTLTANAPAGKTDLQRPPLYRIDSGYKIVTEGGRKWLVTLKGYSYALDHLILESEYLAHPTAVVVPAAEVETALRSVKALVAGPPVEGAIASMMDALRDDAVERGFEVR